MLETKQEQVQPGPRGQFLSSLAVFDGLNSAHLCDLEARCSTRILERGDNLIGHLEVSDSFLAVLSGSLDLLVHDKPSPVTIRLLPGDLVSESALRFYLPQFAVLVAGQHTELALIPVAALDAVLSSHAEVRHRVNATASRHLLRMVLAANELFSDISPDMLAEIARKSMFVFVKRGEVVIREGDSSDGVYVVASGTLEVFRQQRDGAVQSVDILREGASVGEMAALLNEPRSTSVRAWRDALLIRVPDSCMQQVFETNPHVTLKLARTLGDRLKRTTTSLHRAVPVKTISVVPWCGEPVFIPFCRRLYAGLQSAGRQPVLLTASDLCASTGEVSDSSDFLHDRYSAWLAAKESAFEYVVCQCDKEATPWTVRSLQQADLVIIVARFGDSLPDKQACSIIESARASGARVELVLLRDSRATIAGAARWLDCALPSAHHHLRIDNNDDYDRLVRRLTGQAWGVILGGGGARGLAHIGVLKALQEHGIPIDAVGGTSMGAVIAGLYAAGFSSDEISAACRRNYVDPQASDLTVPFVSLRSGKASIRGLQNIFGDRLIEDLPLTCFFVSCDLTRAESVIHDRGPVALWTRVSCSVPGLLPPVAHDGRLLVDGGLLENLPVTAMRTRAGGYVVASDVSVAQDLPVARELEMQTSWSGIGQLLRKFTHRPRLPHIIHLLMRSAEIGSVRDSKLAGSPADLYLHPPLDAISMTDFKSFDRIVAIGYEHASARLQEWKSRRALRAAV